LFDNETGIWNALQAKIVIWKSPTTICEFLSPKTDCFSIILLECSGKNHKMKNSEENVNWKIYEQNFYILYDISWFSTIHMNENETQHIFLFLIKFSHNSWSIQLRYNTLNYDLFEKNKSFIILFRKISTFFEW
jgi:hypothetical protein